MQKLQNSALRKILGSFRTAPIGALEIELNIPPVEIRINRKIQKYALRTIKMTENHLIRIRTPIFYPPEYQNGIFDGNFIQRKIHSMG